MEELADIVNPKIRRHGQPNMFKLRDSLRSLTAPRSLTPLTPTTHPIPPRPPHHPHPLHPLAEFCVQFWSDLVRLSSLIYTEELGHPCLYSLFPKLDLPFCITVWWLRCHLISSDNSKKSHGPLDEIVTFSVHNQIHNVNLPRHKIDVFLLQSLETVAIQDYFIQKEPITFHNRPFDTFEVFVNNINLTFLTFLYKVSIEVSLKK